MRVCCLLSVALSILLATTATALAEPVRINQVVQTLTSPQGTSDLKVSIVSQDPVSSEIKGSTQQSGPRGETTTGGTKTDPLLSGLTVSTDTQKLGVEIVEEGEVEGTICDCGEILIAGGAFPKWPFLFLAAVPLVFIHDCDDCDDIPNSTPTPTPPSTPTPTPTPTPQVPEPASLVLFGTGVLAFGAGLKRRYTKSNLVKQENAEEDE